MNIRKLLARLNAKSPQYEMGRGGAPEYTPQDIAAALGMVEDVIGREIFCVAWWPDGARLVRKDLQDGIRNLLLEEYSLRARQLAMARLELHLLEGSEGNYRARSSAKRSVEDAEKASWPKQMDKYGLIADAVIMEICAPRHCKTCAGHGVVMRESLSVKCDTCNGIGLVGSSGAWRAERLLVSESAYRKSWSNPYEWIYEIISRRESLAAKRICQALGHGELYTAAA